MPFAEQFMVQGTITAAQTATLPASVAVNCGFVPNKVQLINESWGYSGANLRILTVDWSSTNPLISKIVNTAGGSSALANTAVSAGTGISVYDSSSSVLLGPATTGTTITRASPAACTTLAAHGLATGDQVIMTNNAVMTQLGGMKFTVTVTGATTFTIPIATNVGGLGTGADESAYTIRKVIVPQLYYPNNLTISGISAATSAVVSTTTNHGLTVGQKVRFRVPTAQGMSQMNNLTGLITAVTAATFTVNINSSAFTVFTWPTAASGAFSQAMVVPLGSGPSVVSVPPYWYEDKLDDATANTGFQGFIVGPDILKAESNLVVGVGAGQTITWTAWRADV